MRLKVDLGETGTGIWVGNETPDRDEAVLKEVLLDISFPHPFPQDADRLYFLSMTLRPFHALLEELGNQGLWNKAERTWLWSARLDLRDLQWHLHFQVEGRHPSLTPETNTHN